MRTKRGRHRGALQPLIDGRTLRKLFATVALLALLVTLFPGAVTGAAWADEAPDNQSVAESEAPEQPIGEEDGSDTKPSQQSDESLQPDTQVQHEATSQVAETSEVTQDKALEGVAALSSLGSVTDNGFTVAVTKIADGTGHGTETACAINAAHGYAPGDNTPNDGYVCSNDTVQYRLDWSVAATDEPLTTQITIQTPNSGLRMSAETGVALDSWCTRSSSFSGTLVGGIGSGWQCQITFPAGSQQAGEMSFSLFAPGSNLYSGVPLSPNITVGGTGQLPGSITGGSPVPVEPVVILATIRHDLALDYLSTSTLNLDGVPGLKYDFSIRMGEIDFPSQISHNKGMSPTQLHIENLALQFSDLPEGSVVKGLTDAGGGLYRLPTMTTSGIYSRFASNTVSSGRLVQPVELFIPAHSLPTESTT